MALRLSELYSISETEVVAHAVWFRQISDVRQPPIWLRLSIVFLSRLYRTISANLDQSALKPNLLLQLQQLRNRILDHFLERCRLNSQVFLRLLHINLEMIARLQRRDVNLWELTLELRIVLRCDINNLFVFLCQRLNTKSSADSVDQEPCAKP